MPQIQPSGRALAAISHPSQRSFVCRSCRAHLIRQFHSSRPVLAEEPFMEKIKKTLFGSKESKEKDAKRAEAQSKAITEAADKSSTMKLKRRRGVKYQIAPVIDPKATHAGYLPATTWDDLDHIGGTAHVRKAQDRGEVYQGFMPRQRAKLDDIQLQKLIHHTVVEALTLQNAGRDPNQICYARNNQADDWQKTMHATIKLGEKDTATLDFGPPESESSILKAIPQQERKSGKRAGSTRGLPALPANDMHRVTLGDSSQPPNQEHPWMDMKLRDTNMKLAIIKRLLQLTGYRPSDFLLSSATTLEELYNAFKAKEQPKKLYESEQLQSMKAGVPNVSVHEKKRTLITKEKAVGRWKVIEQELLNRDLPVTGSNWREAKPTIAAEWVR